VGVMLRAPHGLSGDLHDIVLANYRRLAPAALCSVVMPLRCMLREARSFFVLWKFFGPFRPHFLVRVKFCPLDHLCLKQSSGLNNRDLLLSCVEHSSVLKSLGLPGEFENVAESMKWKFIQQILPGRKSEVMNFKRGYSPF